LEESLLIIYQINNNTSQKMHILKRYNLIDAKHTHPITVARSWTKFL